MEYLFVCFPMYVGRFFPGRKHYTIVIFCYIMPDSSLVCGRRRRRALLHPYSLLGDIHFRIVQALESYGHLCQCTVPVNSSELSYPIVLCCLKLTDILTFRKFGKCSLLLFIVD